MNKKISLGAALAFALIVAAAVFSVTMVYAQQKTNQLLNNLQERQRIYGKFTEIDQEVRQAYYGTIVEKDLQDSIAKGYLKGIGDSHAAYYTPEEYAQLLKDRTEEESAGIGVKVQPTLDGYLQITEIFPDSSAQQADIKVGSLIVSLDDVAVTAENRGQISKLLRGQEGSKLVLIVSTEGKEQRHDLVRRIVVEPTVSWRMLPESAIAYVRIREFDANTSNQFNRVFNEILEQDGKALILDLRGNKSIEFSSGGRILDRLVPSGTMYSVVDKYGTVLAIEMSDSNELGWPMVVLVNGETSGAAEMFAQVLMDYQKAKSVGTPTAGNGVDLELIRLSDGSAIEMTVALYKSLSEKVFDGEGLQPDYNIQIPEIEDEKWETVLPENDAQLIKAIEVIST